MNGRDERKRSPSSVLSMKATGRPPKTPTEESANEASSSVTRRRSLPSGRIDQRLRPPSRSLSKTMRAPSAVKPLRVSLAGFEVSRTASPPPAGARQRSPRHEKTTTVPSGESAGCRGRSTVAAWASGAPQRPCTAKEQAARASSGLARAFERARVGMAGGFRGSVPRSRSEQGAQSTPRLGGAPPTAVHSRKGDSSERRQIRQTHALYAPIQRRARGMHACGLMATRCSIEALAGRDGEPEAGVRRTT